MNVQMSESKKMIEITNDVGVMLILIDNGGDGIIVEDFTRNIKIYQHRRIGSRYLFGSKNGHKDYAEVARQ